MYKAMIVEDEMLVRIGIRNVIKWDALGITLTEDAENGAQALELYRSERPDIILTDLRMPEMDGMSLIRNIRRQDKRCRFLILTCVEDFEQAQEAIAYSVSGYLLKLTMDFKEVEKMLQKAVDELREKGCKPYYIYGNTRGEGREWVPMEAYREVYQEICCQERKMGIHFDYIFLASSTNATQSGLLAGSLEEGDERNIVGISVSRNETRGKQVIARNLEEYAQMHKSSLPQNFKEKILFTDQYMENGYGTYSQATANLIRSIYRSEGIPLDMTYTGKAFCGMVKYLEDHQIRNKNILFLHTGGTPLFFDFLEEYNL